MRGATGSLRRLVAANVRAARRDRGLSQEALALESGFHRTFIGHVENARTNVSIDSLERIAAALNTPAFQLLIEPANVGRADEDGRSAPARGGPGTR